MTLARRSGELERTYFDVFDRFARMIADGTFPFDVDEVEMESAPRRRRRHRDRRGDA